MVPISRPAAPTLPPAPALPATRDRAGATGFGDWLAQALGQVEAAQVVADQAARRLVSGEAPDLAQVILSSEKASLLLQLTVQVRNRALEAYQEIMRMPV